jgi:acetyl-coenzyme A synthetase (EC 6.2.1.1)
VITADGFHRRGKIIKLKDTLDTVIDEIPTIEKVIVVEHLKTEVDMKEGRDIYWDDLLKGQEKE